LLLKKYRPVSFKRSNSFSHALSSPAERSPRAPTNAIRSESMHERFLVLSAQRFDQHLGACRHHLCNFRGPYQSSTNYSAE
jgi:hypothetical protein